MSRIVEIQLTKGRVCLIDESDFHLVMRYSWRYSPNTKRAEFGYAVTTARIDGRYRRTVTMHRLLLSPPKDKQVDHINGDRLDNRRANLRLASRSQNMFNARKSSAASTSVYKGVFWNSQKERWHAATYENGRVIHLGFFEDESLAALASDAYALKRCAEFARTNFPRPVVELSARGFLTDPAFSVLRSKLGEPVVICGNVVEF